MSQHHHSKNIITGGKLVLPDQLVSAHFPPPHETLQHLIQAFQLEPISTDYPPTRFPPPHETLQHLIQSLQSEQ